MISKSDLKVLADLKEKIDVATSLLDMKIGQGGHKGLNLLLPDDKVWKFLFEAKDEFESILGVDNIFKVEGLQEPLIAYTQPLI